MMLSLYTGPFCHGVVILYCDWQTRLPTIVFDSLPIISVSLYHRVGRLYKGDERDVP